MKTCPRCKQTKSLDQFYKRSNRKNAYQSHCKTCNKDAVIERTQQNKRAAISAFGGACNRCGYSQCLRALHFHHPDPSIKDDMFHRRRNRSLDKIIQALEEQGCILLCSNCHAEEHCGCSC